MENIVKLDKVTAELQANLKQSLVNTITDENTFIRQVEYIDNECGGSSAEMTMKIKLLLADEVVQTDE